MKEQVFIIAVVVAVSVFVGTTLVVQQYNGPVMLRIADQQSQMVTLLRRVEDRLVQLEKQGGGPGGRAAVATPQINALNTKLEELLGIYKKFDAQQKQAQQQAQKPAQPQEDYSKVHDIPLDQATFNGDKNAPVTIVGFLDIQCPFSARFQTVIDQVLEAYPKQVNYAVKHFPLGFHKQAKPAAKAVLAAGEQGKYYEMLDILLKNNRGLTQEKIEEYAKELKLNMNKFKASVEDKDGKWDKLIDADYKLGVSVTVRGTPTYYLNGKKTKARTLDAFKQEIDEILKAKK